MLHYFSMRQPITKTLVTCHVYGDKDQLTKHFEQLGYVKIGSVSWLFDPR